MGDTFILDSPALEAAVKYKSTTHYPSRRPGRSNLTAPGDVSGSAGYNGYFALKDVSTYNEDGTVKEYRVAVCDGETWDPETETSGPSTLNINFGNLHVASQIITGEMPYIYIKYTAAPEYKVEIVSLNNRPVSDIRTGIYYYLLGEISNRKLIQRHTGIGNGIAQIWVVSHTCL